MAEYLTSVHFPNPADKSVGVISVRALMFGKRIVPSNRGKIVNLTMTGDQARTLFNRLTRFTEDRANRGIDPFPDEYSIYTSSGIFTVDSDFLDDICGSLLMIMIENELGPLLEMYKPD